MTIALLQATDAQLTDLGWTAGQIKEVRKYLKTPGHQRNAHQRGLCRRYSDAQRLLTPVAAKPRFTNGKATKAKKARADRGSNVNFTYDENKLTCELYFKWVTPHNGNENRVNIVEDFQAVFSQRSGSSIAHAIRRIKVYDPAHPCKGVGQPSAEVRAILADMSARFA